MSTTAEISNVASTDMLASHLQDIIVEYESYKKQVRRSEARESISIPIEAQPLDADFCPSGEPFHMVTRDISIGGVGAFNTSEVAAVYLQLTFQSPITMQSFTVTSRVEHCTPCGSYFIVGCRFMTDEDIRELPNVHATG